MSISKKIQDSIGKSSMVRRMFEEGNLRRAKYGPENVFDFSLGNPRLDPPAKFKEVLMELASDKSHGAHMYMSNAGFVETRKAVADFVGKLSNHSFGPDDIIMTVGAAGALNVVLKTILDPGDEVIIPSPYFMEYNFYIDNFGGLPKVVNTNKDFSLDLSAIENAMNQNTKAVLINTPNNPTGSVYSEEDLINLGKVLMQYKQRYGKSIYLISDEPYSKIVYDGMKSPSIFNVYSESILVTSFSKDLSLPGERIGYIAVHPQIEDREAIINGLILCNRILGFVNAPALMQRLIPSLLEISVDIDIYQHKRDILCGGLKDAGYNFIIPAGTFYLFPETPIPDDVEFISDLQEENILTVPGSGFGAPGYFRIAYCVEDETITKALPGFARVMEKYK
ncbi:MAG: pyridoxal phosphate-dependent aminotransferase [Thermodesulfobacteriota bacterium]|nr:pyridoxal phosphate-dependent aminotransferase [Thermodesulfobacteriota bacterium]